MKYSVSRNSVIRLRAWYETYKPRVGNADARQDILNGLRVNTSIQQRNLLDKMKAKGVATKELINRAKGNLGSTDYQNRTNKGLRKEIRRLIAMRITEKQREITIQQRKWWSSTKELNSKLTPQQRTEFNNIKKEELNRVWALLNLDMKKKLLNCEANRRRVIPTELRGVLVGDRELQDKYGEVNVTPVILGGIVPTANMIAFMSLPLKHRTFQKIKSNEGEVQRETRACRQRWNIREKNSHPGESMDQYRGRKEEEETIR